MSKPLVGLLLAAGRGRRFGGNKLLCPLADGTPVAVAAARRLRPACERLIAVLRPEGEELECLLAAEGFEVVICHDADAGMGHSLAAGVRGSAEAFAWVVALADMPYVQPGSHLAVADRLRGGASLAVAEYQGRRGHPVGFSASWFDALSRLTGDQGGKSILAANPDALCTCAVDDPGILRDIDRPQDIDPRI